MGAFLRIFAAGLFVSLIGTLPLGTLNLSSLQIAMTEGLLAAFSFAAGVLVIELLYVRATLWCLEWLQQQPKWLTVFDWVTLGFLLVLSAGSFITAFSVQPAENVILTNGIPRFWLGVLLSAVNPVQIPFWMGWSVVMFQKKLLRPHGAFYWSYIAGIGVGTLLGHSLFIFGGRLMEAYMTGHSKEIQLAIGTVFFFTALLHMLKMYRSRRSSANTR